MIVSLDDAYARGLLLLPARDGAGRLAGLDIIARHPASVPLPDDIVLFRLQLAVVERVALFLTRRGLTAWILINEAVARTLLADAALMENAQRFPFLALKVSEKFAGSPTASAVLEQLKPAFPLVLADFGAGDAPASTLFSGLFSAAVFDAGFIHRQLSLPSFAPLMRALMAQINVAVDAVMAAGVDSDTMLAALAPWSFDAMQGALWPAVGVDALMQLVQE
ncbi:EAL domain-containing protein [Pluralibacter gergoviae]